MLIDGEIPPICIPASDIGRLQRTTRAALRNGSPTAAYLQAELRRARVCEDSELPPHTVRIGSSVSFRGDHGWPVEHRVLVWPADNHDPLSHLSVLSPVGAALVGVCVGHPMPYIVNGGLRYATATDTRREDGVVVYAFRRFSPGPKVAHVEPGNDPGPSAA
jgi:regulator of nucleoside diphosphate kinase